MLNSTPIITCDHLFMLYVFLSVCIAITLKLFLIFLLVGRRGCCVLCWRACQSQLYFNWWFLMWMVKTAVSWQLHPVSLHKTRILIDNACEECDFCYVWISWWWWCWSGEGNDKDNCNQQSNLLASTIYYAARYVLDNTHYSVEHYKLVTF